MITMAKGGTVKTAKRSIWDPKIDSPDIGADQECSKYSWLEGAENTNDLSPASNMYMGYDPDTWEDRDRLRRHTLMQGMSTFTREDF